MAGINYPEMAVGVDTLRETLRVMVAAIMAEGFTEEQAREITTGIMRRVPKDDD